MNYFDEFTEETPAIVMHCGSQNSMYGYSGEDYPSFVTPTVMATKDEDEVFGREALISQEDGYKLSRPISQGLIQDIETMEKVWKYMFYSDMKLDMSKQKLLLTEPPLNPKSNRERVTKIMFETFGVEKFYLSIGAVLSLYASGRTTGVILDSGHEIATFVPVYEGYALPHAMKRSQVGGLKVEDELARLLAEKGYVVKERLERDIIARIKETCCFVALDFDYQLKQEVKDVYYRLPNGRGIKIGKEAFECTEIMFKNDDLYDEQAYGRLCMTCIDSCDRDIKKDLLGNILVAGANTMLRGFAERMQQEVSHQAPISFRVKVVAPPERKYSTWIGGSILSSLSTFQQLYLTRQEYNEKGPTEIHKKCF